VTLTAGMGLTGAERWRWAVQLDEVWIPFYKSFNYELRARKPDDRHAWQLTVDGWLAHVRIRQEPDITAVVGSNESGKTQSSGVRRARG
jgi:hypothetical protein